MKVQEIIFKRVAEYLCPTCQRRLVVAPCVACLASRNRTRQCPVDVRSAAGSTPSTSRATTPPRGT